MPQHQDRRKKYQRRGNESNKQKKSEGESEEKGMWCDYCKRDTHNADQCFSKDLKCLNSGKLGHMKTECHAK
jgi:hypothetical protein